MSDTAIKIEGLSPEERLDLLERLWDSLARTPSDVPVTPEQRAELDGQFSLHLIRRAKVAR